MNSPVIKFIAKTFFVFVVWYLVYELWLLPDGTFGFFFLLGVTGLILAGVDKIFYIVLISIHILITILASFVFSYFIYQSIWSLAMIDMFSRYLIPLSSIGIIPLSIIDKRSSFHERKAE